MEVLFISNLIAIAGMHRSVNLSRVLIGSNYHALCRTRSTPVHRSVSTLISEPAYSWLRTELELAPSNAGVFDGQWIASGPVSNLHISHFVSFQTFTVRTLSSSLLENLLCTDLHVVFCIGFIFLPNY